MVIHNWNSLLVLFLTHVSKGTFKTYVHVLLRTYNVKRQMQTILIEQYIGMLPDYLLSNTDTSRTVLV